MRSTSAIVGMASLWMGGLPVHAQTQTEVLIVTASRFAQTQSGAGMAVSIVEADEVERAYVDHPADVVAQVAGAWISRNSGQESLPALRSPVLNGGEGAGAFLFMEDGIGLRAASFANVNGVMDAGFVAGERLEVIRGPGSAVHGSNALHGAFDVRTPLADGSPTAHAGLAFGPFERRRVTLGKSSRWHSLNWRVDGAYLDEPGWREAAGVDRADLRAKLAGSAGSFDYDGSVSYLNLQQETAGFSEGFQAYRDETLARANPNPAAFRDVQAIRARLRLADLDGRWQVTPYARAVDQRFPLHFVPGEALEETRHTSMGVQTAFRPAVGWQAGLDGEWTRGDLTETQDAPTVFSFTQGLHYDFAVDVSTFAAYVRHERGLGSNWQMLAGLRAESVRFDYDNRTVSTDVGRFRRPDDRLDNYQLINPEMTLWRDLSDGALYLRAARGSRTPQVFELYRLQTEQDEAAPSAQIADSIEIGRNWEFERGRVQLAAYAMRKRNGFFRDADGRNVTDAKTKHLGIEIEADWSVNPDHDFTIAAALAEHRYAFDRLVGDAYERIESGNLVDSAPRSLIHAQWQWKMSERLESVLSWHHIGPYKTNAANTAYYDGHDLFDWTLSVEVSQQLTLALGAHNLFDRDYASRADFAFGRDRYFPGEPRGASLRLNWRR
jgi:iron complex outermembrane recepter protein